MKRSADFAGFNCTRVFVGSLPFSTTWQSLKDHFKVAGEIEYASVLKTPQGQSKGCGMVDYKTNGEAQQAVALLDGSTLDGRVITVKLDVEGKKRQFEIRQTGAPPVPQGRQLFQVGDHECKRVFVGNLAYDTNWQALKDHFTSVGSVELASVLLRPDRTSKGCGMVDFTNHEDAVQAASLLHNSTLDNRTISVKLDTDGYFKNKPEIGARPPVYQVKKEKGMGKARGKGSFGAAETLQSLTQMASMPGAHNFDWPTMIRQMSR